jgi:hypothetical protein
MKHVLAFSLLAASAIVLSATSFAEPSIAPAADALQAAAAPPGANAKIVIKTEPLRNNKIDIEITGQRATSMEGNQVYATLVAPGAIAITVPGGKPESKVEFNAEANKEYVLEVALVPSTAGGFLFGVIGSSAMATYSIALKETKTISDGRPQPTIEAK